MKTYEQLAKQALSILVDEPEAVFFAGTNNEALSWRRGFYYMRKKAKAASLNGETPYDALLISVDGQKVTIKWQPQLIQGELS